MKLFIPALSLCLTLALSSCVSIDQLPPGAVPDLPASGTSGSAPVFEGLDAGNLTTSSAHFSVQAYSQTDADAIKTMAETVFSKVGADFGLYSYLASENYSIVSYRDREEYLKKTHEPVWLTMASSGKVIYSYYPESLNEAVFAHHLTHVILRSYLGEKERTLKWLVEGLAMNQEQTHMMDADRATYQASKATQLRQNRMPFSQMTFFVTNTEEKRRTDPWYQQVESVLSYLLAQGSPLAFSQFLSEVRAVEPDQAISDAYPGKFRNFSDLEAAWKYTI